MEEQKSIDAKILITTAAFNRSAIAAAEIISGVLIAGGLLVDSINVRHLSSIEKYTAVVIGGDVRFGQVHADMSAFIHNYQVELSCIPVAYFVVYNSPGDPRGKGVLGSDAALSRLCQQVEAVKPVSVAAFTIGVNILEFLFPGNWIKKRLKSIPENHPTREIICNWAETIIPMLGSYYF